MATILLADDDQVLRDMYRMRLVSAGYIVHEATDGVMVLEEVKKVLPNLILLDIMMPKMNGLDVLKMLKEDKETQNIPVIVMTALTQDLSQLDAITKKAVTVISKSETMPDQLVLAVNKIVKAESA
jgi:CheY-like chemotaxis protein